MQGFLDSSQQQRATVYLLKLAMATMSGTRLPNEGTEQMYQRYYEAAPVHRTPYYESMIEFRDALEAELIQVSIPEGALGLIFESHTEGRSSVERPQLLLGTLEVRDQLRIRSGHDFKEGTKSLERVRREVFVELPPTESEYAPPGLPLTVFTDKRLSIAIRHIGWTPIHGSGTDANWRSELRRDPLRYHSQHREKQRRWRLRKVRYTESWGKGNAFTTLGDPLPVKTTHAGETLSGHMLIRLIVPPGYPLALARSSIGKRTMFEDTETSSREWGCCFDILYRPGDDTPTPDRFSPL